jgi:hypothetical protein
MKITWLLITPMLWELTSGAVAKPNEEPMRAGPTSALTPLAGRLASDRTIGRVEPGSLQLRLSKQPIG